MPCCVAVKNNIDNLVGKFIVYIPCIYIAIECIDEEVEQQVDNEWYDNALEATGYILCIALLA
jgi:hypothetical protein